MVNKLPDHNDTGTELRQFFELPILDGLAYLLHLAAAWTSVPRFWLAIKTIRFCHLLGMDGVGDLVGHYSGLTKRLVQQFPHLADQEMRDRYLR